MPTGNPSGGGGSGSGQTGGQMTGTGQTGGGPLPGGQPPAAPAGRPPGGLPENPPGGGGGGGGGGGPPPAPAVAAAAGQAGPVPAGNGALKGHPLEVFNGDRSKAKKFMKDFTLWKLCNLNNEALSVPFSRVALCLSYIKGPNVDDWVSATTDDVYEKVHGGPGGRAATHQLDDEDLWNEFAQEFANAFADTASAEHAYAELTKLSMKGKEADQYIATFE